MPKYPKNHKDVEYRVPGRKSRVAGSTKATSDFLAAVHEEHPAHHRGTQSHHHRQEPLHT